MNRPVVATLIIDSPRHSAKSVVVVGDLSSAHAGELLTKFETFVKSICPDSGPIQRKRRERGRAGL